MFMYIITRENVFMYVFFFLFNRKLFLEFSINATKSYKSIYSLMTGNEFKQFIIIIAIKQEISVAIPFFALI